jgi:hypothetical protein
MSRLSEMVFIRNQQTQRWINVTGEDVACWSDKRQYIESSAQSGFWATLGQLLLAGFCCLLMVGCGSAELPSTELPSPEVQARASELSALLTSTKTVETKSDEILKVVESNTTALAAIKAKVDALQVVSNPNGKDGDPESAPEPPATANDTPNPLKVATPAASFRTASDGTVLRWNVEGNWSPTILETSAHLREHGINTDGMTHQEMADIHASIHEGKPVAINSKPVQFVSRGSSCPGGVCPTSRRGLFGKRR